MFQNRITVMHSIQLTLSLTCFIMHFSAEKWSYEYQFDPLFSLTFVGCTVALLALVTIDALRFAETWDRDQIQLHYFTRVEIAFDFIAFCLFVASGTIHVIYDYRTALIIKGSLSMLNGICFFLDAVICNQCQYRWGEELASDYLQRMSERRAFYHLAYHTPTRTRYI